MERSWTIGQGGGTGQDEAAGATVQSRRRITGVAFGSVGYAKVVETGCGNVREDITMEWISMKEQRPPMNEVVLIFEQDYSGAGGIYKVNTKYLRITDRVTHWMPLPPPPKEEQD